MWGAGVDLVGLGGSRYDPAPCGERVVAVLRIVGIGQRGRSCRKVLNWKLGCLECLGRPDFRLLGSPKGEP